MTSSPQVVNSAVTRYADPLETPRPAERSKRLRLNEGLRVFLRNKLAVAAAIALLLILLFCFIGPLVYHSSQSVQLADGNEAPSLGHVLGTSPEGRDELGQLMIAGQSTLEVGVGAALVATLIGVLWGSVAGFIGGILDALMMRLVDTVLSIPYLFFVVTISAIIQPNLLLIILAVAIGGFPSAARVARGEVLRLRELDYVAAAKCSGSRLHNTIGRHITPNMLGVLVVNATLNVAYAILAFASISFLGAGPPPPATNWGSILTNGVNDIFNGYWWELWPAAALIVLTVLAVNVLGDSLGDLIERRNWRY